MRNSRVRDGRYNLERTRLVVSRLHAYFNPEETLKEAALVLPHNLAWGSREHYPFLFYGCLLDFGMRSSAYHEKLKSMYLEAPQFFDPGYIVRNFSSHPEKLAQILRKFLGARFPMQSARRWLELSKVLHAKYGDDPRNLVGKAEDLESLKVMILEIKGFGQKTGGLLIRILYENGLLGETFCNLNLPFIPIDRHDIEISKKLGVADVEKPSPSRLSDIWVEASMLENVDPAETDRNLWLLGSKFCATKRCYLCPVVDLCNVVL